MSTLWNNKVLRVLSLPDSIAWPADDKQLGLLCVRKEYDTILRLMFTRGVEPEETTNSLNYCRSLVMGTPGIGKTYMGSYILWRMLKESAFVPASASPTCAAFCVTYILYEVHDKAYVFDKVNKTCRVYKRALREEAETYFTSLFLRQGRRMSPSGGILLYDCGKNFEAPLSTDYPVMAFSEHDRNHYNTLMSAMDSHQFVMDPWTEKELCAWSHCVHGNAVSWETVSKWIQYVGCIPRSLLSEAAYIQQKNKVDMCIEHQRGSATPENIFHYSEGRGATLPCHVVMQIRRSDKWGFVPEPISVQVGYDIARRIKQVSRTRHLEWCVRAMTTPRHAWEFQIALLELCMTPGFLSSIILHSKATWSSSDPHDTNLANRIDLLNLPTTRVYETPIHPLQIGVLYTPSDSKSEVADAFFVSKGKNGERDAFIGIKGTTSSHKAPPASALVKLMGNLDQWGVNELAKVIICVKPLDTPAIAEFTALAQNNISENERRQITEFWDLFSSFQYVVQRRAIDYVERHLYQEWPPQQLQETTIAHVKREREVVE